MIRLIVFDLDGTLAQSKAALDPEAAGLLKRLLGVARVAVISGGSWRQFKNQLLANLGADDSLSRLSLLPTCGTQFYEYNGDWRLLYCEDLMDQDKKRIVEALNKALDETGFRSKTLWGDLIEDRGSQITLSALGQEAPLDEKKKWDPDFSKRKTMKAVLDRLIPEFSVRLGGTTSIDVTQPGIDKAYGIGKLKEVLRVPISDMVFIGDALFEGGNDFPAKSTGVVTIQVRDPEETKRVIEAIVACLASQVKP